MYAIGAGRLRDVLNKYILLLGSCGPRGELGISIPGGKGLLKPLFMFFISILTLVE
jgi:hypothetical protein